MLRSRLLFLVAAIGLAACHSGREAETPTDRAETTGADSAAFPEHDARTALNAASRGLKACRSEGGPSSVEASVKFEPSGGVSTVDVKPAAEPVATCVRAKLAEVSVMPYRGEPVTMTVRVRM